MSAAEKTKPTGRPTKSKWRPRVKKSELWTRDQKLAMSKLAQNFLEAKAKASA